MITTGRREDVEVEGQRRLARRRRRALRRRRGAALHPLHGAGRRRTRSGRTTASRASRASSTGSGGSRSRSPHAVEVGAPADGELARAQHRTIAGLRRHRAALPFHTPIAARDRARQRDLSRERTTRAGRRVRFATETVVSLIQPYAPHVAEELWERARPRAAVGDAVARGRPGAARHGRGRDRRAGERQGARPPRRSRRTSRRTSWSRALASERVQAHSTARRSGRRSSCPASS